MVEKNGVSELFNTSKLNNEIVAVSKVVVYGREKTRVESEVKQVSASKCDLKP